jgi:hypothetical protein
VILRCFSNTYVPSSQRDSPLQSIISNSVYTPIPLHGTNFNDDNILIHFLLIWSLNDRDKTLLEHVRFEVLVVVTVKNGM